MFSLRRLLFYRYAGNLNLFNAALLLIKFCDNC